MQNPGAKDSKTRKRATKEPLKKLSDKKNKSTRTRFKAEPSIISNRKKENIQRANRASAKDKTSEKEYIFEKIMKRRKVDMRLGESQRVTSKVYPPRKEPRRKRKKLWVAKESSNDEEDQKEIGSLSIHQSLSSLTEPSNKNFTRYFLEMVSSVKGDSNHLRTPEAKQLSSSDVLKSSLNQSSKIVFNRELLTAMEDLKNLKIDELETGNKIREQSKEDSDTGAYVTFDSTNQSVSLFSMKSIRKSKMSKENSLRAESILLQNLSTYMEGEDSGLSPLPFSIRNRKRIPSRLRANFYSQIDNRIIEEGSPHQDKETRKKNFRGFKSKVEMTNPLIVPGSLSQIFSQKLEIHPQCNLPNKLSNDKPSGNLFISDSVSDGIEMDILELTERKDCHCTVESSGRKIICMEQSTNEKTLKRSNKFEELLSNMLRNKSSREFGICFQILREFSMNARKALGPHDIDPTNLEDSRTKLMVKNIPNKFTISQLVDLFQEGFANQFDFVYLVVDPKTDCNQGYGFINLLSIPAKYAFFAHFNKSNWPGSKSGKVCEITYAAHQTPERIDQVFVNKYFRESNKYWVPASKILAVFPQYSHPLHQLEQSRRNSLLAPMYKNLGYNNMPQIPAPNNLGFPSYYLGRPFQYEYHPHRMGRFEGGYSGKGGYQTGQRGTDSSGLFHPK